MTEEDPYSLFLSESNYRSRGLMSWNLQRNLMLYLYLFKLEKKCLIGILSCYSFFVFVVTMVSFTIVALPVDLCSCCVPNQQQGKELVILLIAQVQLYKWLVQGIRLQVFQGLHSTLQGANMTSNGNQEKDFLWRRTPKYTS